MRRAIIPILLLLSCSSCSRERHDVVARLANGQVVFTVNGTVGVIPHQPCLHRFFVENEARKILWLVERRGLADCKSQLGFPLIFGHAPKGFISAGGDHPLEPSKLYVIEGDDERTGAGYVGGFRLSSNGQQVSSLQEGGEEIQRVHRRWMEEGNN